MLNKTKIQQLIFTDLEPLFHAKNFVRTKHQQLQFRKTFKGGHKSCIFNISPNPIMPLNPKAKSGEFWIELSVGIRIDVVENFANQFTLTLKNYYKITHTILTSYGRLTKQPYFRFKINTEQEVLEMCQKVRLFLEHQGFDFLDKHQSLQQIDTLLNDYPEKPSIYISNQASRCIKGVIIAKICQNPHFTILTKAYRFILSKQPLSEQLMIKYDMLVVHLTNVSVN